MSTEDFGYSTSRSKKHQIIHSLIHLSNIPMDSFHPSGPRVRNLSLERFQSDPSVRALLLPVKRGANGLTLVEATHVFLVRNNMSFLEGWREGSVCVSEKDIYLVRSF